MSFADLYSSGEHRRNLAHFAALATLASIDGEISTEEKKLLDRFARKLDITESEYKEVFKKENKYPIDSTPDSEKRLERLYDLFRIVYSDHEIDDEERLLIKKYAIGLGFTGEKADKVIERSVAIFGGKFDFEDYLYLLKK
ncbi:TerB family tellurite resistance protein [Maribacter sp. SA7]|uniref:tellurite resistance TerB family protein n=1 Tax=Maribacter zhoushanensis TaxID=3030012 RepID=UPI0023EC3624|nr:TerB family tellurite resistance protein [Maribacter zhoushanensis]MDF4201782.1 TerB family tellurite resistance protein [Maribacter zhoushanensis]